MRSQQIVEQSELKLHILKAAIALSGRKPEDLVKLPFVQKMAYQLGVTVESLKSFQGKSCFCVSSSNADTLDLIKFIADVRNQIINPKPKEEGNAAISIDENVKDSINELDKVFALFQLALAARDPDECTTTAFHIPSFVYLVNYLCDVEKINVAHVHNDKLSEDDLKRFKTLLNTDDLTQSDAAIKKLYHKAALKFHPDKNLDSKEDVETKFKELSDLYERFCKHRPKIVTSQGIKMRSGGEIATAWVRIYMDMKIAQERGNRSINFSKTYKLYHRKLMENDNTTASIEKDIKRCTKALYDKNWYHNKIMLTLTYVNLLSMSGALIFFSKDTDLYTAMKLLQDKTYSYPLYKVTLAFTGLVAIHKIGEERYQICRMMDFMPYIITAAIAQVFMYGALKEGSSLATKVMGLDIVLNLLGMYGCYKIAQHYNKIGDLYQEQGGQSLT